MTKPRHGIWIDDPVKDTLEPAFWDKMVDHGFSTGAIMLEGLGDGFDPNYKVETLQRIKALSNDRSIEIVLTTWPEPTEKYMAQFDAKIGTLLDAVAAAGLEFDCESNWHSSKVEGYKNLDKAGDVLVQLFQRVSAMHHLRTEVTTYPYHTENSKTADVAPHSDRLLPQAYSVRNRDSGGKPIEVEWGTAFAPGKMQVLTLDKAKAVPGVGTTNGPLISCGLAAYDQVWPGHTGEDAMRVAYEAACVYQPVEIRWWSSKWVFGKLKNGYASRYIKSLKGA